MKPFAFRTRWLLLFVLLMSIGLSACNLPAKTPTTLTTPTLDVTRAFQTVQARLTQAIALTPSVTLTPSEEAGMVTETPVPLPTLNPLITPTTLPALTTPTILCDRASAGADIDVTIPDDSQMQPGQTFTKIWRLTNAGACTWTSEYNVVWFSGEKLGAPLSVPLSGEVASGQTVDISVDMVAPQQPGTYQSYWKLRNASNVLFGIGPTGSASFWVRIVVVQLFTPTPTPTPTATLAPTITPTAGVKASGPATLIPGDVLDLDTNLINSGNQDLSYQTDGTNHLLDPVNGAAMGIFSNGKPTLSQCQSLTLSTDPFVVEGIAVGTYLCYRTNMALPGWAQVTSFDPDTATLKLEIYTWSIP